MGGVSHLPLHIVLQGGAVGGWSPAQDVFIVYGVKPHFCRWSERHRVWSCGGSRSVNSNHKIKKIIRKIIVVLQTLFGNDDKPSDNSCKLITTSNRTKCGSQNSDWKM